MSESGQPLASQNGPYAVGEPAGTRHWCACGRSATQPYCDGSHKTTPIRPIAVTFDEPKTVYWCGCRRTDNPPLCDGSHKKSAE